MPSTRVAATEAVPVAEVEEEQAELVVVVALAVVVVAVAAVVAAVAERGVCVVGGGGNLNLVAWIILTRVPEGRVEQMRRDRKDWFSGHSAPVPSSHIHTSHSLTSVSQT